MPSLAFVPSVLSSPALLFRSLRQITSCKHTTHATSCWYSPDDLILSSIARFPSLPATAFLDRVHIVRVSYWNYYRKTPVFR